MKRRAATIILILLAGRKMCYANNMSTDKQYKAIKSMGWYQQGQESYRRKKYGMKHWVAIVIQKGKPNRLECVKCGIVIKTKKEYQSICFG